MMKNFFSLTFKSLKHRPIRSWLTVLGVIIGVMLVVIILSLGGGIQNSVRNLLNMFGSDYIYVLPGKETDILTSLFSGQKFREKDLLALEGISGVKTVAAFDVAIVNIEYRGEKQSIGALAGEWKKMRELFEMSQGIRLESGTWPTDERANETVLGYLAAHELFRREVRIGDEIIVKSRRMKVRGVVDRIGIRDDDNRIYVSTSVFRELTGSPAVSMAAWVKVEPDANINLVAQQIKHQLGQQEVVRDFTTLTPDKTNRIVGNILLIIEMGLIVIAAISLLVGAVGIMNTMYTSVLERTKQIGIMKAIGASSDAILSLFLIESGLIGAVGGILGIIFGTTIAYIGGLAASKAGIDGLFSFAALDFLGFFAVLIIAFITGVVAGFLPARAASRMEPADALRYE